MADNYDQLALKWVREEVNKTLDQARQALESYAENSDDNTQIRFCVSCMHQVRGTLQMLEFYGAALFAEEMEYLAEAIAEDKVKLPSRALEVLMGAVLQLPTYLERVQAGQRDLPVILLPLLNDLRASRGETLLSESAIFTPTIVGVSAPQRPPLADQPKNDAEYIEMAKKLRHHYQRGLLGVLRNQDVKESLQRLHKVVERLEYMSSGSLMATLWWVCGGFIEAIAENNNYKNASVHALLGQVDKYLKHLSDGGTAILREEVPADLLKNLLYYVACAQGNSDRLRELHAAFDLRAALPNADDLEAERRRMTGSDATAIRTVLAALNEDLAGVKDGLDLFVRSKQRQPQDLLNLIPTLRQIADTLGMLGLGVPRDAIRQQVKALQQVADSGQAPTDAHVMDIAGAMLFVEANLATVSANAATLAAEETDTEAPATHSEEEIAAEAQFDTAREVLVTECRNNLQKCKDSIIDFMASNWDHRLLDGVPTQLIEVQGGLNIIGLPEASVLVGTCQRFLAERVVANNAVPEASLLDSLADVLTSVEYFLESMQEAGGQGLASVLASAEDAHQQIVQALASAQKVPEPSAPVEHVAPAPAPIMPSRAQTDEDMIDEEVIEIFIEEAAEQLDVIRECLPKWQEDEDDRDSLITIRRAFHTLKGSGRLVGASLLGETAWSMENMLNRVIDGSIAVSRPLFEVLNDAANRVIPALHVAFAEKREPELRPEPLMARADALSKGETAAPAPVEEAPVDERPIKESAPEISTEVSVPEPEVLQEPVAMAPVAEDIPMLDVPTIEVSEGADEDLMAEFEQFSSAQGESTASAESGELAEDGFAEFALPESLEEDLATLSESISEPEISLPETPVVEEFSLPSASVEEVEEEQDNVLFDIFAAEAGGHLDAIDQFITDAALSPFSPKVSDNLIRALHTLKGSARMANLEGISALMFPLEKHARELQNREANIPEEFIALLNESKVELRKILPLLQQRTAPNDSALFALAQRAEGMDISIQAAETSKRDPEVLTLFLSEGMDLVSDAELAVRSWQESHDLNARDTLVELMAGLMQAAETAKLENVAQLAAVLGEFYQRQAAAEGRAPDTHFFTLANKGNTALFDQFDRIAADQASLLPVDLVAQLQSYQPELPPAVIEDSAEGFDVDFGFDEEASSDNVVVSEAPLPSDESADIPLMDEFVEIAADTSTPMEAEFEDVVSEEETPATSPVVEPTEVLPGFTLRDASKEAVRDENAFKFDDVRFDEGSEFELDMTGLEIYLASDTARKVEIDADGEEIMQVFLEEADDILNDMEGAIAAWAAVPNDLASVALLQRQLHTLKGGARLSELNEIGDLSHELENLYEAINAGQETVKPAHVKVTQEARDRIADLVNEVRQKRTQTKPGVFWQRLHAALKGEDPYAVKSAAEKPALSAPTVKAPETKVSTPVATPAKVASQVVAFPQKEAKEATRTVTPLQGEFVRVAAESLEGLVNLAGETSIYRGRLEQQMTVLRTNLKEMEQTVARLREQLRSLEIENEAQIQYRREAVGSTYDEFDPLEFDRYTRQQEVTRSLSESVGDLLNLKETLDTLTSDSETLLLQQSRVNSELQDGLMRTRMVPFSSVVPRLKRMVRQIGEEVGKGVELGIHADGEMDRTVLERMIAPLEHMIRNAIDHGIERTDLRRQAGKPDTGRIKVRLFREGGEVVIDMADDGGGINVEAVRKKAIERGLITEHSQLTDHELMALIMEAGFSTAESVTQISGRGVGMDVVASEIKELGGRIEIDSERGKGTRFTIRLPFTVSVNQALMVQVGEDYFAIPLANIEGIVRVSPYEIQSYYGEEGSAKYEYAGQQYRMRYLGQLLDHHRQPQFEGVFKPIPILLLHGAEQPVALQVDELLGSREVVVKSVGSLLSHISGLSGATILGDGRVVFILDLPALLRRADAVQLVEQEVAAVEEKQPLVLVVDDSITVRKVTARLLERHSYRVITAKDGVDAVNVLHDHKPDIMLLDIEMPRMDGFELATIIRHDERLKDVPIIMITSRTGDKHRARAAEIGVDRYLGKPFNDVELLNNMSELLHSETVS